MNKKLILVAIATLLGTTLFAETIELNSYDILKIKCDKGNGKSCYELAEKFSLGSFDDGLIDNFSAVRFYKKSCKNKFASGCSKMSYCYTTGKALPINENRSLRYASKACLFGDDTSCKK